MKYLKIYESAGLYAKYVLHWMEKNEIKSVDIPHIEEKTEYGYWVIKKLYFDEKGKDYYFWVYDGSSEDDMEAWIYNELHESTCWETKTLQKVLYYLNSLTPEEIEFLQDIGPEAEKFNLL